MTDRTLLDHLSDRRRCRPRRPRRAAGSVVRRLTGALGLVALVVTATAVPASATVDPVAVAVPTEASVAHGVAGPAGRPLSWSPPELTDPTVVRPSSTYRDLKLSADKDYVVVMPEEPLRVKDGLVIAGGRNVVLVGGTIEVPARDDPTVYGRGLYLKAQRGTIHIEGLHITGAGLGEGIDMDQRYGAVVQLQNVRVDTVQGSRSTNHADVIQTWAGPRVLRIDGLSGSTQYQGFFLLPKQFGSQPEPEVFDLRRVDLRGTSDSGYMIWRDGRSWPLTVSDVWVSPRSQSRDQFLWPKGTGAGTAAWPYVKVGTPPGGEFVPAGSAGTGYLSPGYFAEVTGGLAVETCYVGPSTSMAVIEGGADEPGAVGAADAADTAYLPEVDPFHGQPHDIQPARDPELEESGDSWSDVGPDGPGAAPGPGARPLDAAQRAPLEEAQDQGAPVVAGGGGSGTATEVGAAELPAGVGLAGTADDVRAAGTADDVGAAGTADDERDGGVGPVMRTAGTADPSDPAGAPVRVATFVQHTARSPLTHVHGRVPWVLFQP